MLSHFRQCFSLGLGSCHSWLDPRCMDIVKMVMRSPCRTQHLLEYSNMRFIKNIEYVNYTSVNFLTSNFSSQK